MKKDNEEPDSEYGNCNVCQNEKPSTFYVMYSQKPSHTFNSNSKNLDKNQWTIPR
jgi:hypothetical protein